MSLPFPSVGLSPYVNILYPGSKAIILLKNPNKLFSKKRVFGCIPIKPLNRQYHLDKKSI